MFPAKTCIPLLEPLEDRLTPALSYAFGGGSLFVLGSTANPTVTVTSDAAGVTVADGAASVKFAVTGSLNVFIQMTAATPTFNYDPSVDAPGTVNLSVNGASGVTLNVAGTSNVNINGPLLIVTGAGNDAINIDNVNPTALILNGGAGYDTVLIGDKAPVTVRGILTATNVNVFGLGNLTPPAPAIPVTVQGLVQVFTDFSTQVNNIDVEPGVTIQGSLFASMQGPHEILGVSGTVLGSLFASLGAGADDRAFIFDGAVVGGNVVITASPAASTRVGVGTATVGGNMTVVLGNGTNAFAFGGLLLGTSLTYLGGSGHDEFDLPAEATALNARLYIALGAGDDAFNLNSNNFGGAFVDGGPGVNTFITFVPVKFPLILLQF